MKKSVLKIVAGFILAGLNNYAVAQTENPYVVNVLKDIGVPKGAKLLDVVYSDGKVIAVEFIKEKMFHFQQFSNDMVLTKETDAEFDPSLLEEAKFKKSIIIGGKVYFLFSKIDRREESESFFTLEFFPATLTVDSKLKLLASAAGRLDYGLMYSPDKYTMLNPPEYYITRQSIDHSKLLLAYRVNGKAVINVFDPNMESIWTGTLLGYDFQSCNVSNNGDVIFTSFDKLICCVKNSEPREHILSQTSFKILDLCFFQAETNEMFLAGQFSDSIGHFTKGCFLYSLSSDYKLSSALSFKAPAAFVTDTLVTVSGKDIKAVTTKGYAMNDGSVRIVSEDNYKDSYHTDGNRMPGDNSMGTSATGVERILYYSGDLLVTSINKEKMLEWTKIITKKKVQNNKRELSYFCLPKNNELHLFFNDQMAKHISGVRVNAIGDITELNINKDLFNGWLDITNFVSDGKSNIINNKGKLILAISVR